MTAATAKQSSGIRGAQAPAARKAADADAPRIVMVIPRGEALRNFVYSDTLTCLCRQARVTLLSVVHDSSILKPFESRVEEIIPLRYIRERPFVNGLRSFIDLAHFRWIQTEVGREFIAKRRAESRHGVSALRRLAVDGLAAPLANRVGLKAFSGIERWASQAFRPDRTYLDLFQKIRPALVFNGSHIHGAAADEPMRAARSLGIPTAAFIFSWDNLTSRGRIHTPYDYHLVWHSGMKREFARYYGQEESTTITGTPQFDFHFKPEYTLSREELCRRIGIDPARPFILYTTGIDHHFPEEHRTVEFVARALRQIDPARRPQLVVRTYIKGTSPQMYAIGKMGIPDVVFPPVLWTSDGLTPLYEDLVIYSSMLKHAAVGVNVASTVSLELMMNDKPIVNLGFDPPGSALTQFQKYERHLKFDHYRPLVESGAVMVARSADELLSLIRDGLSNPERQTGQRAAFVKQFFGDTLDGKSGERVAERLLDIARNGK